MIRLLLIVILLFNIYPLFSQIKTIYGAVGTCMIVNITPEEAHRRALEEAKREALKMAGIEEFVRSSDVLVSRVSKNEKYQKFVSFSSLEMRGGVVSYTLQSSTVEKMADSNLYAIVKINAKVKRYSTVPDAGFKIYVHIPSKSLKHGEHLNFDIEVTQKGYLTIFLIDEEYDVNQLFPNAYETKNVFEASKKVSFPLDPNIEYTLEKKNGQDKVEQNLLVFMYTKSDINLRTDALTYESVLEWIYSIEPSERSVSFDYISIF